LSISKDFLHHSPSGQLDKKSFIEYYKKLNPKEGAGDSFE